MRNLSLPLAKDTRTVEVTTDTYKTVCTTCIVGNAVEESKSGSFDEDSHFERFDVLDPTFPGGALDAVDYRCHPETVLMSLCGGFTTDVVRVMGDMEKSWLSRCNEVQQADLRKAAALWGFARERAHSIVELVHGCDYATEFVCMGDQLFT